MKIGAAVKIADLAEHAQALAMYPALIKAAGEVGTPQIRNQGTVGGNINQRPRCWYFRNEEFVCFKKGGTRCFAPAGENQFHAIFGNGPSHIVHPSSLAVPAVAYGAKFRLVGPKGERIVDAADYFTMPTLQNVVYENVLAADEIFTHLILPRARQRQARALRSALQGVARLADRVRDGDPRDERRDDSVGARRDGRGRADSVAVAGGGEGAGGKTDRRGDGRGRRGRRARRREADEPQRIQGAGREDGGEARDTAGRRDQDGLNAKSGHWVIGECRLR